MKEVHVIILLLTHMEAYIRRNGNKGVMNYIMKICELVAMSVK
jgi:hypothetical protein